MSMAKTIECSSPDGITIGLIDSLITIAQVLNERLAAERATFDERRAFPKTDDDEWAYFSEEVHAALVDLAHNPALTSLMYPRDEKAMKIIHDAAVLLKPKTIADLIKKE